jgi:hypothetical protein
MLSPSRSGGASASQTTRANRYEFFVISTSALRTDRVDLNSSDDSAAVLTSEHAMNRKLVGRATQPGAS